jgi:hypothetical protein
LRERVEWVQDHGRMMPRWVRLIFMSAVAFGAWLMATPAWAASSAPFCDDRGAIMFAPTPTLQVPAASIDIGDRSDDCVAEARADRVVQPGRAPAPVPPPCDLEFVLTAGLTIYAPTQAGRFAEPLGRDGTRVGVRRDVVRPPR